MRKMTWYVSMAVLTLAALPAAAQTPGFMTLDRQDDATRFGFQLGLGRLDDAEPIELAVRAELYGNFLLGRGGGIYAQLPMSWLVVDDADDELAMQNLEVGGFFLLGHAARGAVLRAGLSLPTAEDDDLAGILGNALAGYERITDLGGAIPESTWLRLSASPLLREGNLFMRFDACLDVLIDDDDRDSEEDLLGRLNAGLGVLVGNAALTFELANIGNLDGDGDFEDRWLHTLGIGARFLGSPDFHVGLVLPLDENPRGDLWILSFGIHGAL